MMPERTRRPLFDTENGSVVKGLITSEEPTVIGHAFQSVQNITITRKGFGPRKGYKIVGSNDNTGTTGINSLYSYKLSNVPTSTINGEVLTRSHTTWLEWYNEVAKKWHTLVAGLTSNKRFGFAPFNTTTVATAVNRLFFCNGVENYSEWNGATTVLNGATVGAEATITVDDTTLFSASGSLLINGTTVTYTGKTGTTFTGCANVPAASDNDGVAQLPDTSTYSARPKMNLLLTAFSRVWGVGGDGAVGANRLYYSQAGTSGAAPDPTNFTAAANLVDPGFRDFPEGGPRINAITQQDDKIHVWKEDVINTYTFDYSQTTKYDIVGNVLQGKDIGCGAFGAVTEAVSRFFYVSKRGGLKRLGREEGSQLLRPFQLTERILPTIESFDFDNAVIHYDQKNNLILLSCASASGIDNDTTICYDIRKDAITLFKNVAAKSFATHKGNTYFGASTTAKVYQLFDGLTDNGSPINASAKTQSYTFGDAGSAKGLDTFWADGYIKSGKKLNIRFDFDDNTQASKSIELTGDTSKNYIYALSANSFGQYEFGSYPFGGDPEDFSDLYVFRVGLRFRNLKAYNCAATFWSSGPGESWFIKNFGFAPVQGEILTRNIIDL